jgi:hypothetical protein
MSAPNYRRSRQVLQALVQGVDPETSAELPMDTVLNRVDVVRALLAAIEALDAVSARAPQSIRCETVQLDWFCQVNRWRVLRSNRPAPGNQNRIRCLFRKCRWHVQVVGDAMASRTGERGTGFPYAVASSFVVSSLA